MALNRQREKRAKVATKTLLSTTAISALYMTMMPKRKETTTAIVAVSATQAAKWPELLLHCIVSMNELLHGTVAGKAQRLKKALCHTALLSHVSLTRTQCLPAAAEGAKLSTMTPASYLG